MKFTDEEVAAILALKGEERMSAWRLPRYWFLAKAGTDHYPSHRRITRYACSTVSGQFNQRPVDDQVVGHRPRPGCRAATILHEVFNQLNSYTRLVAAKGQAIFGRGLSAPSLAFANGICSARGVAVRWALSPDCMPQQPAS